MNPVRDCFYNLQIGVQPKIMRNKISNSVKKKILLTIVLTLALSLSVSAVFANTEIGPANVVNSITLSGNGADIKWFVEGYSAQGFKVVWSKNENPTYPLRNGDKYHYYSNPARNYDNLEAFAGAGTYYVRVCEYLGGACDKYSNQITVNFDTSIPGATTAPVKTENTIELYGDSSGIGNIVKWTDASPAPLGYKVVWSRSENPTYPTRDGDSYHYISDPYKGIDALNAFNGDGVYYIRVCEYTDNGCGIYSNQISLKLAGEKVACTTEYEPVCGADGISYPNKCTLVASGKAMAYYGSCTPGPTATPASVKDTSIIEMKEKSKLLNENKLEQILAELNELRNLVKEQQNEIKYLRSLMSGLGQVTEAMKDMVNNFVTYGVDDNTKKLGAGERAAVLHSYKEVYGKLPDGETEMTEVIKIANGRWPSEVNVAAEAKSAKIFEQIYGRQPDMTNVHDMAAIKVMTYGLRQKAQNRNLFSEGRALKTFKAVFGHVPETTADWNILQAITYSGASR